jgi:hypothetical protein
MKNIVKKTIDATENIVNNVFREYEKKDDSFFATNRFYISEESDSDKIFFQEIESNEKIIPYDLKGNIYISINKEKLLSENINNELFNKKYIDLILLSNISFSLEDIYINKSELIHKIIENDFVIDEKLFEDLYFNEVFSKKINLELPKKYDNKKIILEDIDIEKKYLFKINIVELNSSLCRYKEL